MIVGVATETIVVSTRIMKNPRHRANRAGHGLTSGTPESAGACGRAEVSAMSVANTRGPTVHPAWTTSTPAARSSATPRSGAAASVSTAVIASSGTTSNAEAAPIFSPLPST